MLPLSYGHVFKTPDFYKPPDDSNSLLADTNYPNLNSLDYSLRGINHNLRMHDAWECIAINKNDDIVIGTNKLSGREWYATLWGFEQLEQIIPAKSAFKLRLKGLIRGLECLGESNYVIALQTGHVEVWSTYVQRGQGNEATTYCPFSEGECLEHAAPINCLTLTKKISAATGDQDGMVKLWDLANADLVSTHTYRYAHLAGISSVAANLNNANILTTCSYDKSALMWDIRETRPATFLYKQHEVAFRALAWTQDTLYIGDESGNIHIIDHRKPNTFLHSIEWSYRPIHKILPNGNKVAVITDTNIVKISNGELSNDNKIIYENADSQHFVRDGVWRNNDEFLTVGFEGKLRHHFLTEKKSN